MRFINRKEEMGFLQESYNLSERKLFSIAIYGLRRVGKTRLIEEFTKGKGIYFFISKNKTTLSLLSDFEETLRIEKILSEFEVLKSWEDFFRIIFERCTGIIVFDEFQNFTEIDKSIMSTLQKFIDLYENKKKNLLFIFSGSTIGLLKKLFLDEKEPLYGRLKRKLFLKPLSFADIIEAGKELRIDDITELVELCALFGGFPLYYVAIEDEHLEGKRLSEILERFYFMKNAIFEDEVERILSLELGKRRGRYYDILTAIARGNTTISKVAAYLSVKETKLSRYVDELVNYFEIVGHEHQVIGNKKLFIINNPIINFWFKFFYKEQSLYKSRNKVFLGQVKRNLNNYLGSRFELICREFLEKKPIFEYDSLGRQWGKIPNAPKDKNQYEIDICAINNRTKDILFGECKWKDGVNAERVLAELKDKAKYVSWNDDKRREHYAIFAKSFEKRTKEAHCFDLNDLEKALQR